jgi:geranylgeranyl diphosphate synthase type II
LKTAPFEDLYNRYTQKIEQWILKYCKVRVPRSIYQPMSYILSSGGKRVRPVLVLLSCEAVGGNSRQALPAAVAIEILHNFTLVHDDVMDNASLRRGRPTIHTKWDTNIAILTGDQMAASAYQMLLRIDSTRIRGVAEVFTNAFNEVCEGQGLDKEFESQSDVDLNDYLIMIAKKTGRVIAASAEIGALIGGGSRREVTALRRFGEYIGLAFQVKDDLLDVTGDEREFGKTIGGDIIEGKKTFLLLRAFERARGKDRELLRRVMKRQGITRSTVRAVRSVYDHLGVLVDAERTIERCTDRAQRELDKLPERRSREMLRWLSEQLLMRSV